MKVFSLPDITCTGSAQQISSTSIQAKWFRVFGVSIASAAARVGDSAITQGGSSPVVVAAGSPVTATIPFEAPPVSEFTEYYDLSDQYVVGTSGDKLSVVYAAG